MRVGVCQLLLGTSLALPAQTQQTPNQKAQTQKAQTQKAQTQKAQPQKAQPQNRAPETPAVRSACPKTRRVVEASYSLGKRVFTPTVEASITRALAWLATKQNPKGYWPAVVGHKLGNSYNSYVPQPSLEQQRAAGSAHLGVTALVGMAFLSGGHLPGRGRYGKAVQKAVDYVLTCIRENGIIIDGGTRMYSHAFATLFLAEVHGMGRNERLKKGLTKAVQIIVDCQNEHGAWRYNPFTKAADLSVTVCQLQALRAARNIGITVSKGCIDRAVEYVRRSRTKRGRNKRLYYYKIVGHPARWKNRVFAYNAAAVTALISAGIYERELYAPAIKFLEKELPQLIDYCPDHFTFWYGNYYAAQAFFHAETLLQNRCFERYYLTMRDHLLRTQKKEGRWINDVGPGDTFSTAVACILLQVPNQYLPIFQR